MRRHLMIWLLLLLGVQLLAGGPDKVVSCHLKGVSFETFADYIFTQSGVRLYYPAAATRGISISLQEDSLSVRALVEKAVRGTPLLVSGWNGHLVLLPGESIPTQLPGYGFEAMAVSESKSTTNGTADRFMTGRAPEVTETITIGKSSGKKAAGRASLEARVLDAETGEPIFNATLYFPDTETGTVTNEKGVATFKLRLGKNPVRVEFLGYERKNYLLDVYNDGSFTIRLPRTVIQMDEFVVYGDKQMSMRSKDPGMDKISMKSIRELPMLMGERDVLRVSGTLPGIVSAGEGASGMHVRGGSSDQNAFYINNIPVYNTSHLFGFFPAFNSEIIRDFSVYKGYIPAEYGGRLSSVFNIGTRVGNRKRFSVHGGLSPITGNIVVEGPLIRDTLSVLLSARSSYSDWLLQRIEDPDIQASSATFNDFAAGLNFDVQKTQVAVFGYRSYDKFRLADINDYNYTNQGVSLSVGRVFSPAVRGELSLVAASYDFGTQEKSLASSAYTHAYRISHYQARFDVKQTMSNSHSLDYGLDLVMHQLNRGVVEPYGLASLRNRVDLGREKGMEGALYVSDTWEPSPRLNVSVGLRMGMFAPLGPETVRTYQEGFPLDDRYVIDSLQFGLNKPVKWYAEPDLRAAINYTTDENGSVKLAFTQMHQHLFLLNNTVSISPSAQWKLADYYLKPSASNQVSAGVFRNFPHLHLETSAELYYKKAGNFTEFRDGADFVSTPHVETLVLQGEQTAWGLEVFVKHSHKKIDGWLSYTYSRSQVQVDQAEDFNDINNGKIYPSNYDMPHVVNMVLNYRVKRRVILSTVMTYQSGRPTTFPVSFYYVEGVPMLDYSNRNAYRLPDYFRADVSLTIEGSLKKRKPIHSSLVLSVYNLTGHDNPYSVYFKNEDGRINAYQYSVIGVPIFTATWLFKLGNYATE